MKISDVIKKLKYMEKEHGDVPLFFVQRVYDAGGGPGLSDTGGGWSTKWYGGAFRLRGSTYGDSQPCVELVVGS